VHYRHAHVLHVHNHDMASSVAASCPHPSLIWHAQVISSDMWYAIATKGPE
jgi:hypothetical protein